VITLTPLQQYIFNQIKAFIESDASVFILRGYAGTGKTTMIKIIADYIAKTQKVVLMAPTGRAARVLASKTSREASTIHRAIYGDVAIRSNKTEDIADLDLKYIFPVNESNERIVAIIDEASMLCSRTIQQDLFQFGTDNLMNDLLTFVRPSFGGKLIFVGDPAQLPPVGESSSNALNQEFFKNKGLNVMGAELTEVLRQTGESAILKNAMKIRNLLDSNKRNRLVFEEKSGEVEKVEPGKLLECYLAERKNSNRNNCVVICYSNQSAYNYNKNIRESLYETPNPPLKAGDILMVVQNNYSLDRMNGELVPVFEVGAIIHQSAPVYVQNGGTKEKMIISFDFVQIKTSNGAGESVDCLLLLDLLNNGNACLSYNQQRALYINFRMRNQQLKPGTEEFGKALKSDKYYNCLKAKYGYAVTGHKCQGGEWGKVYVDYSGRTGMSDDCLRWAYTATTRAKNTLYVANFPHITPFSKFRIDPIQKCRNIESEFRVFDKVSPTLFHDDMSKDFLKAKYWSIVNNLNTSHYKVNSIISKPYVEMYYIQTPKGVEKFDIYYKASGVFQPAIAESNSEHTKTILMLLNDERSLQFAFNYIPSDKIHENLFNMIRSVCDGLSVQITNVVEHPEDFSIIYYLRTSGSYSYLKVYVNHNGFVTYAKPMSLIGTEDYELDAIIKEIKNNFV